mgnify:CR=1 FL=1
MSKEEKNTYTIKTDENLGEVKIADEVVAIIAGLAAMEVEGVASMAGNGTDQQTWNEVFIQGCKGRCTGWHCNCIPGIKS